MEARYRQRYLDLISNEESRRTFIIRSKVVRVFANSLFLKGFMEVETLCSSDSRRCICSSIYHSPQCIRC